MIASGKKILARISTNMPAMVRFSKKGRDVAFSLLGIPSNMIKMKKTKEQKYIDKRLLAEETTRVR
jgi:hypothetical protein